MGFKQKHGVFRHVTGQPLLCEQSFDAEGDAEAFARTIDGSIVLSFAEYRPSYEEREASREGTFVRRDEPAAEDAPVNAESSEKPRSRRRA